MKKVFIVALLAGVAFLTGCNSGGGDPKPALMSFMEALNRQDFEGAKKYATAESASILDMTKGMGNKKEDSGKFDLNKLEVGEAKIESDIATIPVKVKENGMVLNYKLKKESGAWKVAFDKSSLMSMGMDAMSQNADKLNINDSIQGAIDELKNMPMDSIRMALQKMKGANIDSLKDVMKEQMKQLDTTH
jgi:hypothetical protein